MYKIEPFNASISSQGLDKHIHLPRKIYAKLKKDKMLERKLKVKITFEELD